MDRNRKARAPRPASTPARLPKERVDLIQQFLDSTKEISSPDIFRKWGAIAAIAGALERKVWVRTRGSKLYPNLYVFLVAPPGIGKSEVTKRVRELWKGLEGHFVASSSVSKASMVDELAKATRRFITNSAETPVESFNSLLLCVNELGVFLPSYENEFMNTLTDLWDCGDYHETKRTSKIEHKLDKVQLNLLAACTPSYLSGTLPEGAWDQGFLSRTILVYSGDRNIRSLFASYTADDELYESMSADLEHVGSLYGEITFTQRTAELLDHFNLNGGEPSPEHPKLLSYNVRRIVHLLKLCMVASISRSDELIVREEDFQRALGWMMEAEARMPEIFKAMGQGGAGKVMEEAWYYVYTIYMKEQKPVMLHRIIQFLQERVPVHNINNVIDLMEKGKMIEKRLQSGGISYVPLGKKADK